jgi:sulfur relay (sulfurtransferase) complex TusBCD TusD component (DsrE family)
MPKTLVILNDPPYGAERSYNALRLSDGTHRSTLVTMSTREDTHAAVSPSLFNCREGRHAG